MQQQKSVQAAQSNKIHQLEQLVLLFSAEGNKTFDFCRILLRWAWLIGLI